MILRKSQIERVTVICPACHHEQREYAEANSTFCHACGHQFQLQKKRSQSYRRPDQRVRRKTFNCPHCQQDLFIPESAMSWQCQHCSTYLDLKTYQIDRHHNSPIETFGNVIVGPKGYLNGTKTNCVNLTVKGKCSSSLTVAQTLTIEGSVKIKGTVRAHSLIIDPSATLEAEQVIASQWHIEGTVTARHCVASQQMVVVDGGNVKTHLLEYRKLSVHTGARLSAQSCSLTEEKVK